MRKFVKGALLVCLTATAVLVVLVASLSAETESFYQENRLLGKMRAGQENSTNDSALAREALLEMMPLGIDREAALTLLRKERFGCQTIAEPVTHTELRQRFQEARGLTNIPTNGRARKGFVDCQTTSPNLLGYKHWIVDLEFDDGHLSDARVAIWNIFL